MAPRTFKHHISMSTQLICGPINLFSFGLYVMFILVRSLRSSRLFCKLRVRVQMNKTKLEINSSLEYYLNGTPSICSWSPTATFFLFYVSAWQNICSFYLNYLFFFFIVVRVSLQRSSANDKCPLPPLKTL